MLGSRSLKSSSFYAKPLEYAIMSASHKCLQFLVDFSPVGIVMIPLHGRMAVAPLKRDFAALGETAVGGPLHGRMAVAPLKLFQNSFCLSSYCTLHG